MNYQINEWYEKYKTGIYRYILSMTHDPQLAEDILQDTFVQLLNDGICFSPGKEQAWLYKVARNKCFNVLKRQKKQTAVHLFTTSVSEPRWEFVELIAPPLSYRERNCGSENHWRILP